MIGKEMKISCHGVPIDGFKATANTVYQFNGWYWNSYLSLKTDIIGAVRPI